MVGGVTPEVFAFVFVGFIGAGIGFLLRDWLGCERCEEHGIVGEDIA